MMNQPGSHIIRSLSVNFHYNGNADGLAIRKEVAGWCNDVLLPSFHSILAEFDLIEEVIRIDGISLDIRVENPEGWKKELSEKMAHLLKEKINSTISGRAGGASVKSREAGFADLLRYYLEFGFLPWFSTIKSGGDFRTEVHKWLMTSSTREIKSLVHDLPDDRSAKRLVNILGHQELETLLAALFDEGPGKISSLFADAGYIMDRLTTDKIIRENLLNDLKVRLVRGNVADHVPGLPFIIFKEWITDYDEDHQRKLNDIDLKEIISPGLKKIIFDLRNDSNKKPGKKEGIIEDKGKKIRTGKDQKEKRSALDKELGEGVFIGNAGAVIIAPFLPTLFSNAGILTGNQINDLSTALSLVHYCTSAAKEAAEFELLLPKVLCGADPAEVTGIKPLADAGLIKEADEMLASVIEYWTVLKDTSVDGLREAFLQRNGKLSFSENEWLLVVEQKSYDMLLEQLSWNISMIKLPWMENILRTQWV